MISIIDYGMGNLGSVKKKLDKIGVESIITNSEEEIRNSNKIILPGVGHFRNAVNQIKSGNLWNLLNEEVLIKKKPILGICLGMQLMAGYSEEGDSEGFGWFDAKVIKFQISDKLRFKVPHIGWNTLIKKTNNPLFTDITEEAEFYFVHSYHFIPELPEDIMTVTHYEFPFVSSIQKDNIFGVQFHPEKSLDEGEIFLKNFANYTSLATFG
jgi:imidazole glycerol-phosphate synthase subunit HisH